MSDAWLTRFELGGAVHHQNGQQFVDGKGFAGDFFSQAHRPEPHGFASHPVRGGIGIVLGARGRRDAAYVLGGENPNLRPDIEMGGAAIYDHTGNIVSVVQHELRLVHATKVTISAPEIVLDGLVKLGGDDASRPASAEGTIDSCGCSDTGNFATKVLVK